MSKQVETHVVITAQAYGNFRHGQVVPVEQLPGDYWKEYLGDGLRFATEQEIGRDFVTIVPNKHSPASVEVELAEAKNMIRAKQARIDSLEVEISRVRNDRAQTESPALLAGKDKEIKDLKVALADAQQKLAKSQAENISLKQELGAAGSTGAGGTQPSEPPGGESPANGASDVKPGGKAVKK